LEQLPMWQRPRPSQKNVQHPIAIDFFAWPALRDRLVEAHPFYFASGDFSFAYRKSFKFNWPFPFEDTFVEDEMTGAYHISPLFQRYHRDLTNWGMERTFFQRYPELTDDIAPFEAEKDLFTHNAANVHERVAEISKDRRPFPSTPQGISGESFDLGFGAYMEGLLDLGMVDFLEDFSNIP